jgi:hypothetical protein
MVYLKKLLGADCGIALVLVIALAAIITVSPLGVNAV